MTEKVVEFERSWSEQGRRKETTLFKGVAKREEMRE